MSIDEFRQSIFNDEISDNHKNMKVPVNKIRIKTFKYI